MAERPLPQRCRVRHARDRGSHARSARRPVCRTRFRSTRRSPSAPMTPPSSATSWATASLATPTRASTTRRHWPWPTRSPRSMGRTRLRLRDGHGRGARHVCRAAAGRRPRRRRAPHLRQRPAPARQDRLARLGIEIDVRRRHRPRRAVEAAFRPNTRLAPRRDDRQPDASSSPTSPALAEIAHRHGARLTVDNTFASPYLCRPLRARRRPRLRVRAPSGSAATRTCWRGVVVGGEELIEDGPRRPGRHRRHARAVQRLPGAARHRDAPRAHGAPLVKRAGARARAGGASDSVARSCYPGLPSHPQFDVAQRSPARRRRHARLRPRRPRRGRGASSTRSASRRGPPRWAAS